MHLYEKNHKTHTGLLLAGAVFVALMLLFAGSLFTAARQSAERETEVLDRALRRAIVTCYAVEGRYPPSLAYIDQNYGVSVDKDRYAVFYDAFAANVMPTVQVTRIGGGS
ncbi:MAG: hypothetical protein LLF75_02500 [Eubacteriales bacterium]|nr:hypothetical protein [Eubacteriales bacterium]